ncbi:MAG: sugar phosphate isomerase/epimerase [Prolixibacteraceae bacterium]|nr:sugar phosphate isomerase/epimerase [Prolixibacteraceae bacterium]
MKRRRFIQTTGLSVAGLSLSGSTWGTSEANGKTVKRPLCVFTKCLQFLTMDEMGEVLAQLGFDGADIPVRAGGQIDPSNVKTELPQAVKTLRKYGVEIPMIVTAITDPDNPDSVATLQAMADSGINYYRMGWLGYEPSKSIQQNLDDHRRTFEKLAKLNERLGIHGGYQNHSGIHVGAPVWDLYDLLKDVDPRFLGVQYDIRHAVTEGGYSWILGMKRIAPWIRTVDIKDFVWGRNAKGHWRHQNVPLGEGMVSFDEFLTEYASLNAEAPISIHYEYDLGGAETGKKTITMDRIKIYNYLKKDLDWFKNAMKKNRIET